MNRGLARYARPYLAVSEVLPENGVLQLRGSFGGEVRLTTDPVNRADLLSLVSELRNPQSDEWRALTADATDTDDPAGSLALVRELDAYGLIAEAETPKVEEARACVEKAYADAVSILEKLERETLSSAAQALRLTPVAIRRVLCSSDQVAASNFFTQALALQATYQCRDAPVSAWLTKSALHGALTGDRRFPLRPPEHGERSCAEEWSSGLFSVDEIAHDLTAFCELIRRSSGNDALRRTHIELPAMPSRESGSNFILAIEHAVGRTLAGGKHQPTDYVPRGAEQAFLQLAFLQEFHVTKRFTSCIAPLIAKQLPVRLTRALERYFSEEIGHERFELSNCVSLGLSEAQVLASRPLPLGRVFVDCLIAAASQSPIVCFCSTLFTEGLVGTSTSLLDFVRSSSDVQANALKRELSQHVGLNQVLEHRYVGREWMAFVPWVDTELAHSIVDWVSFLLEFNQRMWNDVADAAQSEAA